MSQNEKQVSAGSEAKKPEVELSPDEKLEGKKPGGSPIPGAQNPESAEIKKEVNPNTE
ncbi:MAG: hypothetical protein ABI596_00275 [Pyrinomonadaceae bacterium]